MPEYFGDQCCQQENPAKCAPGTFGNVQAQKVMCEPASECCDQTAPYPSINKADNGLAASIKQRLYQRKAALREERERIFQEIERVNNALNLIDSDEGVAKIIEVFSTAKI